MYTICDGAFETAIRLIHTLTATVKEIIFIFGFLTLVVTRYGHYTFPRLQFVGLHLAFATSAEIVSFVRFHTRSASLVARTANAAIRIVKAPALTIELVSGGDALGAVATCIGRRH